MHKFLTALFTFVLFCGVAQAQDFDNYKQIQSTGKIPKKFTTSSTDKFRKDVSENISKQDKRRDRNAKQRFYVESNFAIDELLLSGKVLFNDPVSNYVNSVLDELLKNDKELRGKVEVYVIRTDAVNAFTTNNGIIFVCMGLIAQLENEAQLAYILSHELVHFQKQHALDEFMVRNEIERGEGKYRYHSYDERLLARSNYSKEKETESDIEGFKIYQKSNYDLQTVDGVFDVLEFAHLPFDEVAFKKDFLETKDLIFPDTYFLKETKAIEADETEEEYGTHPSVKTRRAAIKKLVKDADNKGRKEFILNSKEFYKAQQICRYEMASTYLLSKQYEDAVYTCYLLMQDNPNSIYLKKNLLKALYGLTKYANADKFNEVHTDYEDVQGSKQQVHYLFETMTGEELNATALNYAWKLQKQYPKDDEIKDLTEDIFTNWVRYFYSDYTELPNAPKPPAEIKAAAKDTTASADTTNLVKKKTKYDKIKEKLKEEEENKEEEEPEAPDFAKYAFIDELKDSAFVQEYRELQVKAKELDKEEKQKKRKKYKKQQEELQKKNQQKGYALGLNKVVFVNPFYYRYDYTKKSYEIKVANEQAQKNLSNTLKESAKSVKLQSAMLDKKSLNEDQVDAFNDLALLNEYISLAFDNTDMDFIHPQQEEIKKLAAKYNTRYFCWVGVVTEKESNATNIYNCGGMVCYPLIPYFVYRLFKQNNETSILSLVLDAETGKMVMARKDDFKTKDRQDLLASSLYDLCLQLKTKAKKK